MGDVQPAADTATVIAATERVTLGLREFPTSAPDDSDDVVAHAWAVDDLRARIGAAVETVDAP
jgi:hypothetical protein